jgi:multidrug efflux system membrane fusion protein
MAFSMKKPVLPHGGFFTGEYEMRWRIEEPYSFGRVFRGTSRALVVVLLWMGASLAACSGNTTEATNSDQTIPVSVAPVLKKNIPIQVRAVGRVEAYSVVTVRSLVGGEISKVHFREGQDVEEGAQLFTIDPKPYQAALDQAQANLARDEAQVSQAEAVLGKDMAQVNQAKANLARDTAQARNAEKDVERFAYLLARKDVAQEQYDQVRTNAEALAATEQADKAAIETARAVTQADKAALENVRAAVRASQAAVQNARIQLGYCFIRAPMGGRTGTLLIQQGNVVKANDDALVLINQLNPIYVSFSIPEKELPEVKKNMALQELKVEAFIPGQEKPLEQGVLTFVDNTVDSTTGTIRLKGTFDNREKRLWPGQFVDVSLTLRVQTDAVVVPSQAVQSGQQGLYAYVVRPDLSVESRPVVVGWRTNGETVIEEGLNPGERVVTDGQFRLSQGSKVEIKNNPVRGEKRP